MSVVVLLLAACGPSATATPVASTTTPTPKVTGAPASAAPKGQLRVTTSEFSREEFDPAQFPIGSLSHNLGYPMFDSMVGAKADASVTPGLAQRWEMSPDGMSWTFYLRKDVKFHNGDPLTAEDVKFSLGRYMETTSTVTYGTVLREAIASMDVVDPYTLRINMKKTDPYFAFLMAPLQASVGFVMPKKYFEEKGVDYFKRNPVGSGPFKFVRHVLGDRVEFEAQTQHWRKVPAVKDLTVMLVPQEATAAAMLRSGQADIVEISAERIRELEGAGFRVERIPTTQVADLQIYGTWMEGAGPTADVRVRQALSLAINREEVIQFVAGGGASRAFSVVPLFPFTLDIDPKEWQPGKDYDPVRAKQLLQEAGYPQGFKIKLYSFPLAGIPWLQKMGEAVANYWGQIGVTTEIVPTEYGAFRPNFIPAPPKPAVVGQVSVFRNPAQWTQSSSVNTLYTSKGLLQLLHSEEVDRLVAIATSDLDPAKRQQALRELFTKVRDSYVTIPVAYVDGLFGLSPKIASWQPIAGLTFIGPAFETVTFK